MRVELPGATLILGDCLEVMPTLDGGVVDMVLCDLPYGTTACAWDSIIPFGDLWRQYDRLVRRNAAIVLTAAQPFTSALVMSNVKNFKHEWIYEKTNPKGYLSASRRPLTAHESVLVFSFGTARYFPQKWRIPEHLRTKRKHATSKTSGEVYGARDLVRWDDDGSRFPTSVVGFSNRVGRAGNYHPTQKPLEMVKYFIRTYSEPGDLVFDNTMGSGTTGVACIREGRRFIGIESNPEYFDAAVHRIEAAQREPSPQQASLFAEVEP